MAMPTLLIVVCGLSGTERAPLAIGLAQALDAVYLRGDTIERAFTGPTTSRHATKATARSVAIAVAEHNLRLGRVDVVDGMDSVASTGFDGSRCRSASVCRCSRLSSNVDHVAVFARRRAPRAKQKLQVPS